MEDNPGAERKQFMNTDLLSYHSPNLMKPEALEAIFVQREGLARDIIESIRISAETPSKHYSLLIGPRGIGKTHLISLIYHRVKAMEDLHGKLHIAWLREEEWGINSFLDLLLSIFRSLGEETRAVTDRIENLYQMTPDVAEHAAAQLLKEVVGNGTLLLLAENLDEMFAGLGDKGQKKLRSYIQENPFWTIVATSQSLFHSVSRRTFPFFGFFTTHYLEEFNTDDVRELLVKLANQKGDQELAAFIQTPTGRARVRAIRHLAGGNPRIYVIFSQFLDCESLDQFVGAFIKMLDELTPYYQAKMKSLSPQQRKIIEFLCDYRGAAPVKLIAQRCFISHQTTSSQLKILREEGYVHSNPYGPLGRDSYYELHEPLMRLCIEVKKNRGEPIRLFADFLLIWCTVDELRDLLTQLGPADTVGRLHVSHALELIKEGNDPQAEACYNALISLKNSGQTDGVTRVLEEWTDICKSRNWSPLATYLTIMLLTIDDKDVLANCYRKVFSMDQWRKVIMSAQDTHTTDDSILPIPTLWLICILAYAFTKSSGFSAEQWLGIWKELASNNCDLVAPVQLLDVATRYVRIQDPRVLLELPIEERKVLEDLLEIPDQMEG